MKKETRALNVPTSVLAGTAFVSDRFTGKLVQVYGTFVATLQLQGKVSGDDATHNNWVNIGSAVAAPALIPVTDANGYELNFTHLRVNVTAWTSGTPFAAFTGFDQRSDS